jgi:hypothetical protein
MSRSADLLFKVCGFSESIARRDDSRKIIAMSRLRLDRVRLAAEENTHISEPEEPQTLKRMSALAFTTESGQPVLSDPVLLTAPPKPATRSPPAKLSHGQRKIPEPPRRKSKSRSPKTSLLGKYLFK